MHDDGDDDKKIVLYGVLKMHDDGDDDKKIVLYFLTCIV